MKWDIQQYIDEASSIKPVTTLEHSPWPDDVWIIEMSINSAEAYPIHCLHKQTSLGRTNIEFQSGYQLSCYRP